ncbi:unnamed protein product [Allacma fusca]|uniref:Reverse transcriptase domain-containing protein n=1 Tax=Allacma fusca TaxID=39272 RepID=A0A8J2NH18_9HEXA|nr:unnamed protein product [Allacma fusca]
MDESPADSELDEKIERAVQEMMDVSQDDQPSGKYIETWAPRKVGRKGGSGQKVVSREKLRQLLRQRNEFKKIQKLYSNSRRKTAGLILDGVDLSARCESVRNFANDWAKTYQKDLVQLDLSQMIKLRATDVAFVWTPVSEEDVEDFLKLLQADKAPGPDGMKNAFLADVGPRILSKNFCVIIRLKKLPDCLMTSNTIFIPKMKAITKEDTGAGQSSTVRRLLGNDYGFPVGGGHNVTFADDINSVSSTRSGLLRNLDKLYGLATCFGLEFNPKKCQSLSVRASGKGNFIWVETGSPFFVGNVAVPEIDTFETFRYLGGFLDHEGLKETSVALMDWTSRLGMSSLKPQQKLYILKTYLIPRLVWKLTFIKAQDENLRGFDKTIRAAARTMLNLPATGVLNTSFYAPVKEGGLGLMRLRYSIPTIIARRFGKLRKSKVPEIQWVANLSFNINRVANAETLIQSRVT